MTAYCCIPVQPPVGCNVKEKAKSLTTAIKHMQLPLCRFPTMRTESGKVPIKDRNKMFHVTNAMPRENEEPKPLGRVLLCGHLWMEQ